MDWRWDFVAGFVSSFLVHRLVLPRVSAWVRRVRDPVNVIRYMNRRLVLPLPDDLGWHEDEEGELVNGSVKVRSSDWQVWVSDHPVGSNERYGAAVLQAHLTRQAEQLDSKLLTEFSR